MYEDEANMHETKVDMFSTSTRFSFQVQLNT